ncbi:MAG: 16S rRNA (guanine(527)-N(7))-methyltransferase RsmG [Chloroflexi bacterium]|nr:16S rRNA (guanine(527)-N(7))-methyltransferase RsmG [Chloroflexota bacterium]
MQHLLKGAGGLGLDVGAVQERQLRRYLDELLAWNRRVNLTAVTRPEDVERVHFLDSLTVAAAIPEPLRAGCSLIDVGTGAGFPGVPLKVILPDIDLTLVESVAKKTAFLHHLVEVLDLKGVHILTGRAETLATDPSLRERFDVAVSRAVGSLRVLAELVLPFCRLGGRAVLSKKGDISQELVEAAPALEKLGGEVIELRPVPEEVLEGQRVLVVVQKVAPSPAEYPRRPGIPAKRPL